MSWLGELKFGGSAPATPGFSAVAPEWMALLRNWGLLPPDPGDTLPTGRWLCHRPVIPAAESTLGLLPSIALSSARVLPEWTTTIPSCNDFSLNGHNPLNSMSQPKGALHKRRPFPLALLYPGSNRTGSN